MTTHAEPLDSTATRAGSPAASPASRALSLVYGLVAYALFLGTFLYAMGFVLGMGVPKTIDQGRPAPLSEALLVNGGLLALFAVQHTIMARRGFKRVWTRVVPRQVERATFVVAASAILCALFCQWRDIPGVVWHVDGAAGAVLLGGSLAGFGIVLVSTFLIDHFELFGLRQVVRHALGQPQDAPRFVERAIYRHVRHPLMTGFLLAFWCTPHMSVAHLFFAAMCSGYILAGVRIEERSLVAEHGQAYLDYRRRVPAFVPRLRR